MTGFQQLIAAADRASALFDDPTARWRLELLAECEVMMIMATAYGKAHVFAEAERCERLVLDRMRARGMMTADAKVKGG